VENERDTFGSARDFARASPEEAPEIPPEPSEGGGDGEEEEAAEEEQQQAEQAPSEEEAPLEQEEPQGLSPRELQQRDDKVEKPSAPSTPRVSALYGAAAPNLIPVTTSPTAPPGFAHKFDAGRIPEDVQRPILAFFGMPVEAEYEADPNRPACDKCKGKGKIATGSLVPEYRTMLCDSCQGKGYVQPYVQVENGAGDQDAVVVPVGADQAEVQQEDKDAWGHPRLLDDGMLNPNFGKMPQYVDPQFP